MVASVVGGWEGSKAVGEVVGLGAIEFVGGDGMGVNAGSREPPDTAFVARMMWRMRAETQSFMIVQRIVYGGPLVLI